MDKFQWEGISLISVVLGFVGACLGISYVPPMTAKQLAAALVSGIICGALLPSAVAAGLLGVMSWTVPTVMDRILALFFGIGGMFIVPGSIVFWQSASKNPMLVWDWMRGKGPPPPPDEGAK